MLTFPHSHWSVPRRDFKIKQKNKEWYPIQNKKSTEEQLVLNPWTDILNLAKHLVFIQEKIKIQKLMLFWNLRDKNNFQTIFPNMCKNSEWLSKNNKIVLTIFKSIINWPPPPKRISLLANKFLIWDKISKYNFPTYFDNTLYKVFIKNYGIFNFFCYLMIL